MCRFRRDKAQLAAISVAVFERSEACGTDSFRIRHISFPHPARIQGKILCSRSFVDFYLNVRLFYSGPVDSL